VSRARAQIGSRFGGFRRQVQRRDVHLQPLRQASVSVKPRRFGVHELRKETPQPSVPGVLKRSEFHLLKPPTSLPVYTKCSTCDIRLILCCVGLRLQAPSELALI
jgi:hypothetical protein